MPKTIPPAGEWLTEGAAVSMIIVHKCDGNCRSEQCLAMGGGWYTYGTNGKKDWGRYDTAGLGPFASAKRAREAGERKSPEFVDAPPAGE